MRGDICGTQPCRIRKKRKEIEELRKQQERKKKELGDDENYDILVQGMIECYL